MAHEEESPALTQKHFQQSVILYQLGTKIQSVLNNTNTTDGFCIGLTMKTLLYEEILFSNPHSAF